MKLIKSAMLKTAASLVVASVSIGFLPTMATASSYPSDSEIDQSVMFSDFNNLQKNHKDVLKANLDVAVSINNNASSARKKQAIAEATEDMGVTSAEALGKKMSAYYLEARKNKQIPKTMELIEQSKLGVQVEGASSDKAKQEFAYPRPFRTAPDRIKKVSTSSVYNVGKYSFPSGHSRLAYLEGMTLATFLPELAPQILARSADAGQSRVVLGVHYPLDVIAGRTVGTRMVAARWSDPSFRVKLEAAKKELRTVLEKKCGAIIAVCVSSDTEFKSDAAAVSESRSLLTYGLPKSGRSGVKLKAPEGSENLLLTTFPNLTDEQRRQVIELTSIDSGYPLDLSGATTVSSKVKTSDIGWTRIDLATAMNSNPVVNSEGNVVIDGKTGEFDDGDDGGSTTSPEDGGSVVAVPDVKYRIHITKKGWTHWSVNGERAGDKVRRIEAFEVNLKDVEYRSHVQSVGWQGWVKEGKTSGTTGKSLRDEAVSIRLTGQSAKTLDIWYRTYVEGFGWSGWAKNGANSGSSGYKKELSALEIKVLEKGSPAPGATASAFWSK